MSAPTVTVPAEDAEALRRLVATHDLDDTEVAALGRITAQVPDQEATP